MLPAKQFVLFGSDHLVAVAIVAAITAGVTALARRDPEGRVGTMVRYGVAIALAGATLVFFAVEIAEGRARWSTHLPLHLCKMAIFLAIFALFTKHQLACELLYFWAAAGTTLAMLFPELAGGFPGWIFTTYFILHGLVVVAAVVLTFGYGVTPRAGAPLRALLWTNAYALLVGTANYVFDSNFMFLRRKPSTASPLDYFGPWPFYILVGELVAYGLYFLLDLPFRRGRARGKPTTATGDH